jgi:hypothetical protein
MKLLISLIATVILLATPESASAADARLTGTVSSGPGNVPEAGATITVYRLDFGINDPNVYSAQPVGNGAVSDTQGHFEADVPLCNPDACTSMFYAVATFGYDVFLATAIGPTIGPGSIRINEMTTVAMAYAFAQFFVGDSVIITGKQQPVSVAQGFAEELVSPVTGAVSPVITSPPNANQTNTWQELGTLANILVSCTVELNAACYELYAATGTDRSAGTMSAVIKIAHHPAVNVDRLFDVADVTELIRPDRVYRPYLDEARGPRADNALFRLDAFTIAIKFNATGRLNADRSEECPFGGPGNLVFDENGYAWIIINTIQGTNKSAYCQVILKPDGRPSDGDSGLSELASPLRGGGILGQGFGVAIDQSKNIWSGNFGWGGDNPKKPGGETAGSVSEYSRQQQRFLSPDIYGFTGNLCKVQGVAADQHGNIWMASWGNDTLEVFPAGQPAAPVDHKQSNTAPFGVVIDGDGAGWVTNEGTSSVAKFTLTSDNRLQRQFDVQVSDPSLTPQPSDLPVTPDNPCQTNGPVDPAKPASVHPKGLAIDKEGNGWAVASAIDAVSEINTNGSRLGTFSGGGIVGPWGVAVDSQDNIWVANFGGPIQLTQKYGISELCGHAHHNCAITGDAMTPGTGYTLPSGGDQVLLQNGKPLYGGDTTIESFKPLMRMTAVAIDMAGNVWAINNWKPEGIEDTLLANPGGDGVVIFIGLAAPVMPTLYSGPPSAP